VTLLTWLSLLGPFSVLIVLVVVALLSSRLGAVTRRPPLYRWLFVSAALIGVALTFRVASMDEAGRLVGYASLVYDVPVIMALLLGVVVVWRYWGWLLYERDGE
jgi:hypothetical protein